MSPDAPTVRRLLRQRPCSTGDATARFAWCFAPTTVCGSGDAPTAAGAHRRGALAAIKDRVVGRRLAALLQQLSRGGKVLEIGCGDGSLLARRVNDANLLALAAFTLLDLGAMALGRNTSNQLVTARAVPGSAIP